MGFLATLFFIILFFYVLSLLGRVMLRYWIIRKGKQFDRKREYYERQSGNPREGEIRIQNVGRAKQKKVSKNVGEYVEYEEIVESDDTSAKQDGR